MDGREIVDIRFWFQFRVSENISKGGIKFDLKNC